MKEMFKRVSAWFIGREIQVTKEEEHSVPVVNEIKEVQPKKPVIQRMSWEEMKANNRLIDSYFNQQNAQPALRLVA